MIAQHAVPVTRRILYAVTVSKKNLKFFFSMKIHEKWQRSDVSQMETEPFSKLSTGNFIHSRRFLLNYPFLVTQEKL
jgi:hypothetical protein